MPIFARATGRTAPVAIAFCCEAATARPLYTHAALREGDEINDDAERKILDLEFCGPTLLKSYEELALMAASGMSPLFIPRSSRHVAATT